MEADQSRAKRPRKAIQAGEAKKRVRPAASGAPKMIARKSCLPQKNSTGGPSKADIAISKSVSRGPVRTKLAPLLKPSIKVESNAGAKANPKEQVDPGPKAKSGPSKLSVGSDGDDVKDEEDDSDNAHEVSSYSWSFRCGHG